MPDAFNTEQPVKAEDLKRDNTIVTPARESPDAPADFKDQDATGTGTFPPDKQGTVNRSQPAGLSGQTQYGEATPEEVQGTKPVATPVTGPEVTDENLSKVMDKDEDEEDEEK